MRGNAPLQEIDFGSLDDLVRELELALPERSADVAIDQLSRGVDGDTLLTAVGALAPCVLLTTRVALAALSRTACWGCMQRMR